MKLKRSYVFLISLISIFLLLSLSAVSAASDMDNQISDISASDVIDDVDGIEDTNDNILSNSNILADGDSGEGGDEPTVDSTPTTIESEDKTYKFGDNITVPVSVKDNEGQEITYTQENLVVSNDSDYNNTYNFTVNGSSITIKNTFVVGEYTLHIKFLGNDTYSASDASVVLNIIKTDTTIEASNFTGRVGDNVTIPLVIKVESNRTYNFNENNITVFYGEEEYNVTKIDGGIALVNFTKEPGEYNITIKFEGSQSCNPSQTNVSVKLLADAKIEVVNDVAEYQSGNFTFKLIDFNTNTPLANTTVRISGVYFFSNVNENSASSSLQFTSDENGLIFIKNLNMNKDLDFSFFINNFTALEAGKYNLTFKGNNSMALYQTAQITVIPTNVKIIASDYKEFVGSAKKFTFKLVNAATNEALKFVPMQFKINMGSAINTYNATTNLNGECSFNVNLQANIYPITLLTNSANVVNTSVNKTITIDGGILTASNRTIKYGSDSTAIIRFTDKNTGKGMPNVVVKVRLYTTSTKYVDLAFRTNKTGYVKFSAALSVGKHKMIISSIDNNYTASSITRYVTVKKTTAKFSASKVTTYYRSGKLYKVKLINTKNNKAMYGAKMRIKVYTSKNKYVLYSGATASNGILQFKINYKPGTYKVIISANDKGFTAKSITKQIKVTKHPLKYSFNSLKIQKGNTLKVKVISNKTKKVLSSFKIKVRVYTGKKYKTYTIKTNKTGIASLKIYHKIGKHKIIISPVSTSYYTGKKTTYLKVVSKSPKILYIGNSATMKLHRSTCRYVNQMSDSNKVSFSNRSIAINNGYEPCLICAP